jgi:exopolysaccharide biosynthesis polyprenyl glycosylphosphotransferase
MSRLFSVPIRRQQILLFVVDLALLLLSLMLAFVIARFARFNILFVLDRFTVACAIYFSVYSLVFFVGQLYDTESRYEEIRSFLYICGLVLVANLFIAMLFYFFPHGRIARRVMALQAPLSALFIYLWRRLHAAVSRGLVSARRVLLVGGGETMAALIEDLQSGYAPEFDIVGVVDDRADGGGAGRLPHLGGTAALPAIVAARGIDIIVFSPGYSVAANGHTVRDVLDLKARGVKVYELATFYKRVTGKVPVRYIEDQWLLFSQDFSGIARADEKNLKRLADIVLSAAALTVLAPLAGALALLVKATSRGPVLYRQERVGLDKRSYELLKFRTMRLDAEAEGDPRWASAYDARVTAVGRFMRRLRLDELPQFVNVLRGEMSVIGPRPERPFFVEKLERDIPYYGLRFSAKPGLTGWAQVNYRYGSSVEDAHTKLQYDLFYIQEMSPFLDLVILLKTFQTVLFRPGY